MNGRGLIVGFVRPPLREVTLWVVRLEMYVRDREVFKAIEYLVALLYEHLLRVQRAQIHVVLPRTKKKKRCVAYQVKRIEDEVQAKTRHEPRWTSTRRGRRLSRRPRSGCPS
jgi:hypothetical protein